jgi:hypothetical protein
MAATGATAFATAMRMIYRIHRYTADGRSDSSPTLRACFTQLAQIVFVVADLADGGPTVDEYPSHLSGA